MMAEKPKQPIKSMCINFASGGLAGLVEVSIMHPLDLVKTRFQVQSIHSVDRYKSIIDCMSRIYRNEGFLSFYKGILPPILAETPKRATKFFTFEEYKKIFVSDSLPLPLGLSLAGLCSGLSEGFVINPFEVVKVKLQSEHQLPIAQQRSAFATAYVIVKENGFGTSGLSRGLTATLFRHGVWNCVYFGFFYSLKPYMPLSENSSVNTLRNFVLGSCAGFIASVMNIPFDVAKSRIQGPQPEAGKVKYRYCLRTIYTVFQEEGLFALYRGLIPKLLRLAPGGGIMLVVFEKTKGFLDDWLL